jgi:hypothetical protein
MRLAAVSAAAELRCCADRDQGSERERTCAAMGQIMGPSHPNVVRRYSISSHGRYAVMIMGWVRIG